MILKIQSLFLLIYVKHTNLYNSFNNESKVYNYFLKTYAIFKLKKINK